MSQMQQTRWISSLQFMIITINLMVGTTLIVLPRTVAEVAKQDLWLSVLLAAVPIGISFRIAAALAARFPDQTAMEYHSVLLGKFWGKVVSCVMLLLIIEIMADLVRTFRIAIKIFLLDLTSSQVIVLAILVLVLYAVQHGFGPVIRVQQFLFLFSYTAFLVLILLGLLGVDVQEFTPVLADGIKPILQGITECWTAYSGPELAIGLLYPYIAQQNSVVRFGLAGIGAVTVLLVLISGITVGILGQAETADLLIPTIMAYRSVEIPGTFIERIDGYLMIVWIAICFSCLANWFYLTGFGVARLMALESSRPVMVLLIPVIAYLVTVPPDYYAVIVTAKWINYCGFAWGLGVLPLLLFIAWWRERR